MTKVYRTVIRLVPAATLCNRTKGRLVAVADNPSVPGRARRSRQAIVPSQAGEIFSFLPSTRPSRSRAGAPMTWRVPAGACRSRAPAGADRPGRLLSYRWPHLELESSAAAGLTSAPSHATLARHSAAAASSPPDPYPYRSLRSRRRSADLATLTSRSLSAPSPPAS